jgi:hypothetical protein
MWYEKLDYKVDIDRLRKEVEENVFTLGPQVIQGEEYETPQYHGFGGWSLMTRTGDWHEGWEVYHSDDKETNDLFFPNGQYNYKAMKFLDVAHDSGLEHDKPTPACVGYIAEVLNDLEQLGFYPRRARVSCLQAHSKSLVHKDSASNNYMARIHIPLITNEKCVHICDGQNLHMPADGSVYMMWVNVWHQIRNDSDEDRYHIIMDAYDTKRITNSFKYMGDFSQLQQQAIEYRKNMDAVELTPSDIEFFERVKQKFVTKKNV